MMKSLIILTAIFVFFTISEISCRVEIEESSECTTLYKSCDEDDECCSNKCRDSNNEELRFCVVSDDNSTQSIDLSFSEKAEKGKCSYKVPRTEQEELNAAEMYSSYGFNAGHALLLPGTRVEVTYDRKKLLLTINNIRPASNDSILELTKEAATVLGMKPGDNVDCVVKLSTVDPSYSYLPPVIFLIFYLTSMLYITG